jgi:hypothetical protein
MSALTIAIAWYVWRSDAPRSLAFSVLLVASTLVNSHMHAYDYIVLLPAFLLLWNWAEAAPDVTVGERVPRLRGSALAGRPFQPLFLGLLYVCLLASSVASLVRVQVSVLTLSLLVALVAAAFAPRRAAMPSAVAAPEGHV